MIRYGAQLDLHPVLDGQPEIFHALLPVSVVDVRGTANVHIISTEFLSGESPMCCGYFDENSPSIISKKPLPRVILEQLG